MQSPVWTDLLHCAPADSKEPLNELEFQLDNGIRDFPFKRQSKVFMNTVRSIYDKLPSDRYSTQMIDKVKGVLDELHRGRSFDHFGDILSEGLNDILQMAGNWKFDVNVLDVQNEFRKAKRADAVVA